MGHPLMPGAAVLPDFLGRPRCVTLGKIASLARAGPLVLIGAQLVA